MMALAPKGSCMADPAAAKCPQVTRIVAAAAATGCTAVAGRPNKSTWTEVYGPGYSRGCAGNIVYNEIITTLQRYNGSWQQMDVAINSRSGSGDVGATARVSCSHRDARLYRTKAMSYSRTSGGTAYTRTAYNEYLLSCRT